MGITDILDMGKWFLKALPKKKHWMLVVEDDPEDRETICEYLRDCNCNFNVAKSAEEAMGMMARRKYAVVFIDHRLPLMSGFNLMDIIMDQDPSTAPVMVLGQAADIDFMRKGIFVPIIVKPVTHHAIEYAVKRLK